MAQFFVNGAAFAPWGVQVPDIKSRFGLSDFMLSFAMFVGGRAGPSLRMGSIGRWATRAGSARALRRISGVALCAGGGAGAR